MSDDSTGRPAGLQALAERHGVSLEAVRHLLRALESGQGTMAQFDHPDLGGFGQWSRGGMIMVGRMNDHALKARVDALCTELAGALPSGGFFVGDEAGDRRQPGETGTWWPEELGRPASVGAQNATRYAYFPETRRLAVEEDGHLAVYDTGEHVITGASQQQGGTRSFGFSGPTGTVRLEDLRRVKTAAAPAAPRAAPEPSRQAPADPPAPASPPHEAAPAAPVPASGAADPLTILERLAELHRKGVLTEAEFAAKKAELLARL